MALKKFMKWMLVYWILLVSFIISQIHPHKYRVITNTLPLTSLYHPFMTFRINLSLNIHTYTCNWYKIWNSLWILKSFSCISFSMYPGSGDVSSDSIDHSPAKKEGQNCVQMWSCDLQRLPQLNFQEIELMTIIVFFLMLTF